MQLARAASVIGNADGIEKKDKIRIKENWLWLNEFIKYFCFVFKHWASGANLLSIGLSIISPILLELRYRHDRGPIHFTAGYNKT